MTPRLRKFVLTAHVVSSVGWLGAVASVLVLSVAGLVSQDVQMVRAAYLAMDWTGWFVLVPLALSSLLIGVVQSLGSTWGLFRHHWVLFKLLITVLATIVLLLYTQTLSSMAGIAAKTTWSNEDLGVLRTPTVLIHASGALLLLLVATVLAVYKPRGITRYGQRKQHEQRALSQRALSQRALSQP